MGRAPCCDKASVKRGPWSPEEDAALKNYLETYGNGGNWISMPRKAGLKRCGKSCRLRWLNYLRPNIKHGCFTEEEDNIICALYTKIGSRWSVIASQLAGRTDNDVKNHWNTKLKKKLSSPKEEIVFTSKGADIIHSFNNPIALAAQNYSLRFSTPSPAGQYSSDASTGISDDYYVLNMDGQDFTLPPAMGSTFLQHCDGVDLPSRGEQEGMSIPPMMEFQANYGQFSSLMPYGGGGGSIESSYDFLYDELWLGARSPEEGCGVVPLPASTTPY